MVRIELRHDLTAPERSAVVRLVDAVGASNGYRPLPDQLWLGVNDRHASGPVHVVAADDDHVAGYAQVLPANGSWTMGMVIGTGASSANTPVATAADRTDVCRQLATVALDAVRSAGGGTVHWWVLGDDPVADVVASDVGLIDVRDLLQMRVSLPIEPTQPADSVPVRPFRPGIDEEAWLNVNNAAFSWHAEQGGWSLDTIRARESEPWFDPDGFLLHEREGRLAAFCWTKQHRDVEPAIGEIYVIAVHPDFHGLGLGRALTAAGLDHLASRGIGTGMLYVDGVNTSAVGLYRSMGFAVHRTDRAHVGVVPTARPSGATP